jgi:hypothetical protein
MLEAVMEELVLAMLFAVTLGFVMFTWALAKAASREAPTLQARTDSTYR